MAAFLVLLLIAGGGFGFWWWHRNRVDAATSAQVRPVSNASAAAKVAPERRPGYMINATENPCLAAQKIQSAWYAEGASPRLPLESCEHPEMCRCTWMRVLDRRIAHRRAGQDRRAELRFEDKSDRRTGEDRRDRRANVWKNSG